MVVELFSDRVTHYITFNEPQCFIGSGYLYGEHAPGLKCTYNDLFQMAHNVMKAHGAAVIAMRKAAKQPIKSAILQQVQRLIRQVHRKRILRRQENKCLTVLKSNIV